MSTSKTYAIWEAMIQRCHNPKDAAYHYYGARGISVTPEWRQFEAFFRDMGEKPVGLSIDRIDNNGNYEPGNTRWTDSGTQIRNRRNTRVVIFKGVEVCATDAATAIGINPATLWNHAARKKVSLQQAIDYYVSKPDPQSRRRT